MTRGQKGRSGQQTRPWHGVRGRLLSAGLIGIIGLTASGRDPLAQGRAAGSDDGGTLLTFGIRSNLRVDDNIDLKDPPTGSQTVLDNRLSFGLSSVTRSESLTLDATGNWQVGQNGSDLKQPNLRFGYSREASRSRLELTARYAESDQTLLGLEEIGVDPDTGEPVIVTAATDVVRTNRQVGLSFATGIDEPLGFTLDAQHTERGFRNTTDPDLVSSRFDRVTAGLRLDFSPVLSGGLQVSSALYDADDAANTRRRNTSAQVSLSYALDARTDVSVSLGQTRVVTTKSGSETSVEGSSGSLSIKRTLKGGSVGLSFGHSVSASGGRDTLSVSRGYELRSGAFDVTLGATRGDSGDTGVIGSLGYTHETKRGNYSLALSRSIRNTGGGGDVLRTRVSANAVQQLSELSSLNFDLSYVRIDNSGSGNVASADQASATLAWQRELTADWSLSAGYSHRMTHEDGGKSADSNSIFLGIGRDFSFRY